VEEDLSFALAKLFGKERPTSKDLKDLQCNPEKNDLMLFSIIATRLCLSATTFADAHELIRMHMATCIGITEGSERIVAKFPSEPMLASASQSVMIYNQMFEIILKYSLRKRLFQGILLTNSGIGEIGELIGSLLFLRLFDCAAFNVISNREEHKEPEIVEKPTIGKASFDDPENVKLPWINNYLVPVLLVDLIRGMYSQNDYLNIILEITKTCPQLLHGVVYFNHVIKLKDFEPERKHLFEYFERGAMLLLKSGTTG
jgi:hypothetical protein